MVRRAEASRHFAGEWEVETTLQQERKIRDRRHMLEMLEDLRRQAVSREERAAIGEQLKRCVVPPLSSRAYTDHAQESSRDRCDRALYATRRGISRADVGAKDP